MPYKTKIIKHFTDAANSYEEVASVQQQTAKLLINCLQNIYNYPTSRELKILDIGAGTGFVVDELIHLFPNAQFFLNDLSSSMLQKAASKYSKNPNFSYIHADAETATFPQVNLITSNLAFQWFENLEQTLNKLWQNTDAIAFSTMQEGSFAAWHKLHTDLRLNSGLHAYPSKLLLHNICNNLQPARVFIDTKSFSLTFRSPLEFVKYLKMLGAFTPNKDYAKSNLRQVLNSHQGSLTINYEVFYAVLIKHPKHIK